MGRQSFRANKGTQLKCVMFCQMFRDFAYYPLFHRYKMNLCENVMEFIRMGSPSRGASVMLHDVAK